MTHNQLSYAKLLEDRRHNLAFEAETNRANLAKEAENVSYRTQSQGEIRRTNLQNERIRNEANAINSQHNIRSDTEINRANLIREGETMRSNMMSEDIRQTANRISNLQASAALQNAETNRANSSINRYNADINLLRQGSYQQMADASSLQSKAAENNSIINQMKAPSEIAKNTGQSFQAYMSGIRSGTQALSDLTKTISSATPLKRFALQ